MFTARFLLDKDEFVISCAAQTVRHAMPQQRREANLAAAVTVTFSAMGTPSDFKDPGLIAAVMRSRDRDFDLGEALDHAVNRSKPATSPTPGRYRYGSSGGMMPSELLGTCRMPWDGMMPSEPP